MRAWQSLPIATFIPLCWLFGLIAVPLGLFLWNGLGPSFGRGEAKGKVDWRAAVCSAVLLAIVVVIELVFSSPL